ncbi:MAG: hypothetical protein ACE5HS_15810 [bacterium]
MKNSIRMILYGFFMAVLNIFSILVGYGFYYVIKPANQIAFQAPVAAILNIAGYVLWCVLAFQLPVGRVNLETNQEIVSVYLLAFVWIPIIFIPLHFMTQGYLTSAGNITGIWLYQLPTNLIALTVGTRIAKNIKKTVGTIE